MAETDTHSTVANDISSSSPPRPVPPAPAFLPSPAEHKNARPGSSRGTDARPPSRLVRRSDARHCHHQGTHSLTPTRMHGISVGSEFVAATGGSVEEAEGSVAAKASGRRRKPRAPVENTAARSSNVRKRMFSRCSFGFGPIFGCSFH